MQSMCRQNYGAVFDHSKNFCPNIVPYPIDIAAHPRYGKMSYMPIFLKYDHTLLVKHESLPHMWNEWYSQYVDPKNATFPRLIVRMEDLLFHAETVVPQICECLGFRSEPALTHQKEASNKRNTGIDREGPTAGLIRSIIRYGNTSNRQKGYPGFQLQAAQDLLDATLMGQFGYPFEPVHRHRVMSAGNSTPTNTNS
jgi:hypothetical protein